MDCDMKRTDIINRLISHYNYQTYLEIGVERGVNIKAVNAKFKLGLDPNPECRLFYPECFIETSDQFFSLIEYYRPLYFDIIFIDGLHHEEQEYRDIYNSLRFLNEGGTIVCHDMLPTNKKMQDVPRTQEIWTGDCWKAWAKIRSEDENLSMFVIDCDFGCGIIQRGKQDLITYDKLDYDSFVTNKEQWMNIISVDEFKNKFKL